MENIIPQAFKKGDFPAQQFFPVFVFPHMHFKNIRMDKAKFVQRVESMSPQVMGDFVKKHGFVI